MSVATFSSAQRTRSLVAVIAAALSVGIAVGAMVPLISLRLEAQGYSNTLIGINGAMFPIGLLAIGNWLPRILRFLGPLRAVYIGVGVTSASVLLLPVLDNYVAWCLLRLGAGAAGAGHVLGDHRLAGVLVDHLEHRPLHRVQRTAGRPGGDEADRAARPACGLRDRRRGERSAGGGGGGEHRAAGQDEASHLPQVLARCLSRCAG